VIGGLGLVIFGSGLYAMLSGDAAFDGRHVGVTLLGVLAALSLWWLLARIQHMIATDTGLTEVRKSFARRRGLIVLLSLPSKPGSLTVADVAIEHHALAEDVGGEPLEHCWLIGTPAVIEMTKSNRTQYSPEIAWHEVPLPIDGPEDPTAAYKATTSAYVHAQEVRLGREEIVADISGGTKLLTVGMALACLDLNLDIEVVTADYSTGRPMKKDVVAVEIKRPFNLAAAQTGILMMRDSSPAQQATLMATESATGADRVEKGR
jgi:hypothetical protein